MRLRRDQSDVTSAERHAGFSAANRLIIVANRLPKTISYDSSRWMRARPSSGGLATGLGGLCETSSALWVGWSGLADDAAPPHELVRADLLLRAFGCVSVPLSRVEESAFYGDYSNAVLWPALHGMPGNGSADSWQAYRAVNQRYADIVARVMRPSDVVWIHDYHLLLVPSLIRARLPNARIGFFLHTPFPSPASFAGVPHASELMRGLIGADVIGVHTREYASNLLAAAPGILDDVTVSMGSSRREIVDGARHVRVEDCPMGIDVAAFADVAARPDIAARAATLRREGPLFVGVDRLDYTKGIPQRLAAFDRLLEQRAELRGRARLVQIAVPSRERVPGYCEIRREVETTVEHVNQRWGRGDWKPIHYTYGTVDRDELVSLFRAADVMLVTPLCDGLNLVAKEFVASRVDEDGVLVLSERAGAAAELRAALLVDPRDVDQLTATYATALEMLPAERRGRMRWLRRSVASHDVFRWAARCLDMVSDDREPRTISGTR